MDSGRPGELISPKLSQAGTTSQEGERKLRRGMGLTLTCSTIGSVPLSRRLDSGRYA